MLLPLFEWLEATALGEFIRSSAWLFPGIECIHLLGLVMLGGAVLALDLRLLGLLLPDQPTRVVGQASHRLLLAGITLMILTGVPLFLSEAIKCYYNTSFWVKIITLVPAIVFALTYRKRIALAEEGTVSGVTRRLTALASLGMWFTVAAGGRWIGFS